MDQQKIEFDLFRKTDSHSLTSLFKNRNIYYLSKGILDFTLSLIALIVISPIIVVVAILIKLDSPGPVIFSQERVGVKRKFNNHKVYWEKKNFQCYKFRTMVCNADPALHKSYIKALIDNDCERMVVIQGEDTKIRKLTRDPRVTPLGRILRKTSIDEIPQFVNVLKGDMSLVGPRPAIPYEVEMYQPWHHRRLETKPGITGLWQITARSSVDFDETINLDIQYIEQQSFWFDLKILLRTPYAVVFCKGAI